MPYCFECKYFSLDRNLCPAGHPLLTSILRDDSRRTAVAERRADQRRYRKIARLVAEFGPGEAVGMDHSVKRTWQRLSEGLRSLPPAERRAVMLRRGLTDGGDLTAASVAQVIGTTQEESGTLEKSGMDRLHAWWRRE